LSDYAPHSFIIKIWIEEPSEAGGATWRGHVTHVPGGERRYIRDLDQIRDFIAPYLEEMGVRFRVCFRVQQWTSRLKRRSGRAP
jgi:hypothetical protein